MQARKVEYVLVWRCYNCLMRSIAFFDSLTHVLEPWKAMKKTKLFEGKWMTWWYLGDSHNSSSRTKNNGPLSCLWCFNTSLYFQHWRCPESCLQMFNIAGNIFLVVFPYKQRYSKIFLILLNLCTCGLMIPNYCIFMFPGFLKNPTSSPIVSYIYSPVVFW